MVCGMFVCVSLSINVCMFTVSNALLMSNATAMVRVGGMGWLKPVATVLLMLCSAVFVECHIHHHRHHLRHSITTYPGRDMESGDRQCDI